MKPIITEIRVDSEPCHWGVAGLKPRASATVVFDDIEWGEINDIADNLLGSIDYYPSRVVLKCPYCGQWAARKCVCKHCGGCVE